MAQHTIRTSRIEARIAPEALAIVKRAAELQGRSISDFVVDAAQEAAQRAIRENEMFRLTVADQRIFAEALIEPPEPNEILRQAARLHLGEVEVR